VVAAADPAAKLRAEGLDAGSWGNGPALVGEVGVTCLEAHLPAGSLAAIRRFADGTW
jgi:hypothetical protein